MRPWIIALAMAAAFFVQAAGVALAATITVTTAADENGLNPADCSLHEAIVAANTNAPYGGCVAGQPGPSVDAIAFSIGSGPQTIRVISEPLPRIVDRILLDGATQPGFNGTPLIAIRSTAPDSPFALTFAAGASGSIVQNMAISSWSHETATNGQEGHIIQLDGASNVALKDNRLGLPPETSTARRASTVPAVGSATTPVPATTASAAPAAVCDPRPPVRVTSTSGGPGIINVEVQAGDGTISQIDFGLPSSLRNARVNVVGGPQNQTQGFAYTPTDSPTTIQFTVQQIAADEATTVPLKISDACEPAWTSFVGMGKPNAFLVTPSSGLVTTEAGAQATFTVRLAVVPADTVTVNLTSSDTTEGTVSPSSLTFQPDATAQSPQTVTVTGMDDTDVDATIAYAIVTSAATSTDPTFSGVDPPDVTISNQDNDAACTTPRPPVRVTASPGTLGVLNATIHAGGGFISKIAFGAGQPLTNARVSVVGGPQDQTQPFSFLPTTSPTTIQISVQAEDRSLPTRVPLTVTDGCGTWETFVGGGAHAI